MAPVVLRRLTEAIPCRPTQGYTLHIPPMGSNENNKVEKTNDFCEKFFFSLCVRCLCVHVQVYVCVCVSLLCLSSGLSFAIQQKKQQPGNATHGSRLHKRKKNVYRITDRPKNIANISQIIRI